MVTSSARPLGCRALPLIAYRSAATPPTWFGGADYSLFVTLPARQNCARYVSRHPVKPERPVMTIGWRAVNVVAIVVSSLLLQEMAFAQEQQQLIVTPNVGLLDEHVVVVPITPSILNGVPIEIRQCVSPFHPW